ncbi:hypothetical protein ACJBU6_06268 [Exserohilum turcicum]
MLLSLLEMVLPENQLDDTPPPKPNFHHLFRPYFLPPPRPVLLLFLSSILSCHLSFVSMMAWIELMTKKVVDPMARKKARAATAHRINRWKSSR